jgi:hypothetical protein
VDAEEERSAYGGAFALSFYDEVRAAASAGHELSGRTGAVLGRSRSIEGIEWYAVAIDGEAGTTMVPLHQLVPTGNRRRRDDYYRG